MTEYINEALDDAYPYTMVEKDVASETMKIWYFETEGNRTFSVRLMRPEKMEVFEARTGVELKVSECNRTTLRVKDTDVPPSNIVKFYATVLKIVQEIIEVDAYASKKRAYMMAIPGAYMQRLQKFAIRVAQRKLRSSIGDLYFEQTPRSTGRNTGYYCMFLGRRGFDMAKIIKPDLNAVLDTMTPVSLNQTAPVPLGQTQKSPVINTSQNKPQVAQLFAESFVAMLCMYNTSDVAKNLIKSEGTVILKNVGSDNKAPMLSLKAFVDAFGVTGDVSALTKMVYRLKQDNAAVDLGKMMIALKSLDSHVKDIPGLQLIMNGEIKKGVDAIKASAVTQAFHDAYNQYTAALAKASIIPKITLDKFYQMADRLSYSADPVQGVLNGLETLGVDLKKPELTFVSGGQLTADSPKFKQPSPPIALLVVVLNRLVKNNPAWDEGKTLLANMLNDSGKHTAQWIYVVSNMVSNKNRVVADFVDVAKQWPSFENQPITDMDYVKQSLRISSSRECVENLISNGYRDLAIKILTIESMFSLSLWYAEHFREKLSGVPVGVAAGMESMLNKAISGQIPDPTNYLPGILSSLTATERLRLGLSTNDNDQQIKDLVGDSLFTWVQSRGTLSTIDGPDELHRHFGGVLKVNEMADAGQSHAKMFMTDLEFSIVRGSGKCSFNMWVLDAQELKKHDALNTKASGRPLHNMFTGALRPNPQIIAKFLKYKDDTILQFILGDLFSNSRFDVYGIVEERATWDATLKFKKFVNDKEYQVYDSSCSTNTIMAGALGANYDIKDLMLGLIYLSRASKMGIGEGPGVKEVNDYISTLPDDHPLISAVNSIPEGADVANAIKKCVADWFNAEVAAYKGFTPLDPRSIEENWVRSSLVDLAQARIEPYAVVDRYIYTCLSSNGTGTIPEITKSALIAFNNIPTNSSVFDGVIMEGLYIALRSWVDADPKAMPKIYEILDNLRDSFMKRVKMGYIGNPIAAISVSNEYKDDIAKKFGEIVTMGELIDNYNPIDSWRVTGEKFKRIIDNINYKEQPDLVEKLCDKLETLYGVERVRSEMLSPIISSSYSKEFMDAPIKPLTDLTPDRIKKIMAFNNMTMKESPVKVRKLKSETYGQMVLRAADELDKTEKVLSEQKVTKINKTEDELEIDTIALTKFRAGKHGNVFMRVLESFDVNIEFPEYDDYRKAHPDRTLMPKVFHGTGSVAASMILRYGFTIIPSADSSCVGRMLGDGIYFSNVIDKAQQYAGDDGFARRPGSVGYIFEMEAQFTKRHPQNKVSQTAPQYDWAAAGIGGDRIISPEWAVLNPRAQLKIYKAHKVVLVSEDHINRLKKKHQGSITESKMMNLIKEAAQKTICITFGDGYVPTAPNKDELFTTLALKPGMQWDYSMMGPCLVYDNDLGLEGNIVIPSTQYLRDSGDVEHILPLIYRMFE